MRFILSVSALALVASSAALASSPSNRYVVRYDAEDLTIQSGVERIERQIRHASEIVCDVDNARTLSEIRVARECLADAERQALRELSRRVENVNSRDGEITVSSF